VDGPTALWIGILASGVYHGLNPGMGWPLAVAAGLTEQRGAAVARTLALLAAGHLGSIVVVLLPFAAMTFLLEWGRAVRIGAGLGVMVFASLLFAMPRHPRWVSRIRPAQVAVWSLAVGLLHGAGLMLVPMLLGLCAGPSMAEQSFVTGPVGLTAGTGIVLAVAVAHTAALVAAGGSLAWVAFRFLGLKILTRSWFDLGRIWAGSLALAGALGVWTAL
jgi:hypothetical protein